MLDAFRKFKVGELGKVEVTADVFSVTEDPYFQCYTNTGLLLICLCR